MNITAQLLVICAATCWGLLGIFTRTLMAAGFASSDIVASRNLITALCLFSFLFLTDRNKLKIQPKDIRLFLCMGTFGLVLNSTCYLITMNLISLSAASILLYLSPYMVMLQSALVFKEKITKQKVAALLIAFTGCIMTVGVVDRVGISITGIGTGLAAAFCYSLYTIFGKVALQKYPPLTVLTYSFAVGGIILIPFCDLRKIMVLVSASSVNLTNLLVVAFFLTLFPFLCYIKGLEKLEPSRAAIISFVEPLTAAIAGIVVYQEMLSASKAVGVVLIFLSLIILNFKWKNAKPVPCYKDSAKPFLH